MDSAGFAGGGGVCHGLCSTQKAWRSQQDVIVEHKPVRSAERSSNSPRISGNRRGSWKRWKVPVAKSYGLMSWLRGVGLLGQDWDHTA